MAKVFPIDGFISDHPSASILPTAFMREEPIR